MFKLSRSRFASSSSSANSLLMRYPTKLETYATIASCTNQLTNKNNNTNNQQQTPPWLSKLHQQTLKCLKTDSSMENIERISKELSQRMLMQMNSSTSSSHNNSNIIVSNPSDLMLLLSLCHQTGTQPSEAILSKCESVTHQLISSANGSPQYLMQLICCYECFAPHRMSTVLENAKKSVENAAQSLRAPEMAILICQYSNFEVFSSHHQLQMMKSKHQQEQNMQKSQTSFFYETILERAVMICNDFSAHEISQISLGLAQLALKMEEQAPHKDSSNHNNNNSNSSNTDNDNLKIVSDVKDAIEHDLGQRFVQQELSTLRDAADMLYSLSVLELDYSNSKKASAVVDEGGSSEIVKENSKTSQKQQQQHSSPLLREISEACARRLFLMLRDTDAQTFAKILASLSKISLRTPRLVSDLGEISTKMDFSNLHPIAALDCLSAAAELGLNNQQQQEGTGSYSSKEQHLMLLNQNQNFDALFGRLTSRMMSGRGEILRNEYARDKLLGLVAMLN